MQCMDVCMYTCVCNIWIDVKLPSFLFSSLFSLLKNAGGMAAVSLAMPTKLWDPAGRECGRTFLYLHFCSYGKRPSLEPQSWIFTSRLSQSGIYFLLSTWRSYSILESDFDYVWPFRKTYIVFEKYYQGIYFRSYCLGWFARFKDSVPDGSLKRSTLV